VAVKLIYLVRQPERPARPRGSCRTSPAGSLRATLRRHPESRSVPSFLSTTRRLRDLHTWRSV